jgi:hypothetical protein
LKKKRLWIEPEEDFHKGFPMGTIVRDIRSGELVRVIQLLKEELHDLYTASECCCYRCSGSATYFSYRVQLLDGTDLPDGHYRAPEDLEKLSPLVLLAECVEGGRFD